MKRKDWLMHLRNLNREKWGDKDIKEIAAEVDKLIDEELEEQEEELMKRAGLAIGIDLDEPVVDQPDDQEIADAILEPRKVVTVNLDALSNYFQDTLWNIGQVHALDKIDGMKPFEPMVKLDNKFMSDFIDVVYHLGVEADDDGNFIQWP